MGSPRCFRKQAMFSGFCAARSSYAFGAFLDVLGECSFEELAPRAID